MNTPVAAGLRDTLRDIARPVVAPAVRRLRRELQWRSRGVDFGVTREGGERFPHSIAAHATPLVRQLAGVDPQLQLNKVVNLRIAANALDGVVLTPGVRLSFWRVVGRPSRTRGFVDGLVLDHGRPGVGVGGGLCQMTNLLYWMTLHTPLEVVERWRHSYDVFPDANRTQPFGSGATCAWPVLDLQVENRTGATYRLSIDVTTTHLQGEWCSDAPTSIRYRVHERGHLITHEAPGTYVRHNELWRIETGHCNATGRESLVATNHALIMYEPFLPPSQEGGSA